MKSQKATPRGDNLRLYFIVCIFAILCVTLGVSALLTLLLEWLTNTHFTVPTIVWMVLFSVVLGGGLSIIMSRFFLRPVTRMGRGISPCGWITPARWARCAIPTRTSTP